MTDNAMEICGTAALNMRKDILKMGLKAGPNGAHIGGSLSLVEILAVLYGGILRHKPDNPLWEERDRLILSKGHCVMALYAAMKQAGLISQEDLEAFEDGDSWLCSHATINLEKGIEFSTGSLGQGLSLGVGAALALRLKNNTESRIFVILGDGECNEGQVWEAAMSAASFGLQNLYVIVDHNKLQLDGFTKDVMDLGDLGAKWRAFGWAVVEVDGNDCREVFNALASVQPGPLCVIAHTVKGRGVSFMQDSPAWHHKTLSRKEFAAAMAELEGGQ